MRTRTAMGIGVVCIQAVFFFGACGREDPLPGGLADQGQPERWSPQDNPAGFLGRVELKLEALPMEGQAAQTPWPGSYWPTYQDSINQRWDGDQSEPASVKYERAFGGQGLEDAVSRALGIDSQAWAQACKDGSDCKSGDTCAKRFGKDEGYCIPTWFGLCHGWAPAAILELEPKKDVTVNGVIFKVNDIKALISLMYNRTRTAFLSTRCELSERDHKIVYDAHGRPYDSACRDTNPGTFHAVLGTLLGQQQRTFIGDLTLDYQVWNFPLRSYQVREKRAISIEEANALLDVESEGGETRDFPGNTLLKGEWKIFGPFPVTPGKRVDASTLGDGNADLLLRFGAAPTAEQADCHPGWGSSNERCLRTVPEGASEVTVALLGVGDSQTVSLRMRLNGTLPKTFAFNQDAAQIYRVETGISYVTESSSYTDGPLVGSIDSYTGSRTLKYLLELDGEGRILGGEWLPESERDHPDFLWLPFGPGLPSQVEGRITYENVKMLIDLAQ